IADMDYVKGVYFLLYDPNGRGQNVDETSIHVYLDDNAYGNLANKVRGHALLDPSRTASLGPDTTLADTLWVGGSFKELLPGPDQSYDLLRDLRNPYYQYVRLHNAISQDQTLAVTYKFRYLDEDPSNPIRQMGGQYVIAGADSELWMKLIRAPASKLKTDSLDSRFFDLNYARSPLNATRELELKNFYDLQGKNIDPKTFTLTVRRLYDNPPVVNFNLPGGEPVPYL